MAWLHATPKPDPNSRRGKLENQPPPISRREQMKKDGIQPQMPPNPAPHIIGRFIEMGMTQSDGMGRTVLSWSEISAWCERTMINLPPWESRLMRELSSAYLSEGRVAESGTCPPPWRGIVTQRERDVSEANLDRLLG
ncbi:hypothetical protein C8J42_103584 [Sphingomonas sp. PP-CE-1A-559]|nr:hypothetical protein C8J42_103584 [Sphingomonas sp. PP-CE-1A-559]